MVEEVYRNIYRIGVALPGNPLRELNSYLIRGRDRDLLIDTGFRRPICQQMLEKGLSELGSDPSRRDVLVTHLHSDHCGMADLFAGPERHIYMSGVDLELFALSSDPSYSWDTRNYRFHEEGFPAALLEEVYATNPARTEKMPGVDHRFLPLKDGDVLRVGDYALETLLVPGHTPGNCMFYLRDQQVMFTGDHVLFDITPNITNWVSMRDSLGSYLDQLRRVRDLPVRLALPGHRKTGNYRDRVDAILAHHKRRLDEVLVILGDRPGLCGYDIAAEMRWKIRARSWEDFPPVQKWFAVGECMSHLDYHLVRGSIRCEKEGGLRRYYLTEE